MKLIKDGETFEHIYSSHDRWLEDLDDFIETEFSFSVFKTAIDLMDKVSAHLIYWLNDFNKEECAEKVSDKILENKVLKRLTDLGETGGPELIIYEFGGTSIYDECNSGKITYNEQEDLITIKLSENKSMIMNLQEFEASGGEIEKCEDEDDDEDELYDEDEKDHYNYYNSGNVYFFMKDSNLEEMSAYLYLCVLELNKIYESLGLGTIKVKLI